MVCERYRCVAETESSNTTTQQEEDHVTRVPLLPHKSKKSAKFLAITKFSMEKVRTSFFALFQHT
jgi:hypothetical protein